MAKNYCITWWARDKRKKSTKKRQRNKPLSFYVRRTDAYKEEISKISINDHIFPKTQLSKSSDFKSL